MQTQSNNRYIFEVKIMNNQPFDLNDIENGPSDEQLHSLMSG